MLELVGVEVERGGFQIVRGVDLEVPDGQITVLLGPNGAGKTTLLEAISGVIPTAGGTISIAGSRMTKAGRRRRALKGLTHVEQGRTIFPDLTVHENLRVVASDDQIARAYELFPELRSRRDVRALLCSGGEQQMLVLARACVCEPKIIMIDELSLGLAPVIVKRLMPAIRRLADEGIAVLLVEQFAYQALEIGDRACVLNHGATAFSGTARELLDNPEKLRHAYLGEEATTAPGSTK